VDFSSHDLDSEALFAMVEGSEDTAFIESLLTEDLYLIADRYGSIMIMHKGGSKACAIAELARIWAIPRDEIAVFGDDINDLCMLYYAGTAIAMSNAVPQAKEIADYICLSNNEDGMARWLEERLLRGDATEVGSAAQEVRYRRASLCDVDRIRTLFAAQSDAKARLMEVYLREQQEGARIVIVAEVDDTVAGYVTLFPVVLDAVPFRGKGIPEIKDFQVFPGYRHRGIGTGLMDRIEAEAAKLADEVCLGVGLHAGYGAAQRMYTKRGYLFDGSGVWSGEVLATPYALVQNDDDLILYMSKKLR